MKDNKFKVFNQFNISQSPYMKGESDFGDSLVDYTVHVPTLKEYLEEFILTGHCSARPSRYPEYEDDSEEFEVQDFRDSDIDEIREYQQELNEKIKDLEKKQKQKNSNSVPENISESHNNISNNENEAPENKERKQ